MEEAIRYLKDYGYDSFELAGVLIIPVSSPDELYVTVSSIKKLLDECGYNKSWSIDPYYYQRHQSLTSSMYD